MCYRAFTSTTSWYDANAACEGEVETASLAVVGDANTQALVAGLVSTAAWVGMTDIRRGECCM